MRDELTIGEFARRSGLSTKALRLYEERGFLRPVRVDPGSGYRYYSLSQLDRARTVALLRRLDLPLADIADVLDLPPERIEARLRGWWDTRHRDLDDRHGTLELVIRALAPVHGSSAHPEHLSRVHRFEPAAVRVVSLPETAVATVDRDVAQEDLVSTFIADALTIRDHLIVSGAQVPSGYWVEYHDAVGPGIVGAIRTCVPYIGPVEPTGDIVLRAEPPRQAATIDLEAADCSYPEIMAVYAALGAWVEANARPSAPIRERYTGVWCSEGIVGDLVQPIDPA